eukprot:384954-Prymnesium_polylepis.1
MEVVCSDGSVRSGGLRPCELFSLDCGSGTAVICAPPVLYAHGGVQYARACPHDGMNHYNVVHVDMCTRKSENL